MAEFDNNTAGTWTCSCGKTNTGKFCVNCGAPRPVAPPQPVAARQTEWVCACGKRNTGKFCVKCGSPRPAAMQGKLAGSTVTAPPRNSKPATENGSEAVAALAAQEATARKAAEEAAARKAAEEAAARKAAEEAAARKAAEEAAARKAAEEAAARKAAEEAAARKAAEEAAKKKEVPAVSAGETDNNGMMKKVAIGAAVLLLLIGAYFMFGKKKETPSVAEPPKVETKAETEKKDDGTAKPGGKGRKTEKIRRGNESGQRAEKAGCYGQRKNCFLSGKRTAQRQRPDNFRAFLQRQKKSHHYLGQSNGTGYRAAGCG